MIKMMITCVYLIALLGIPKTMAATGAKFEPTWQSSLSRGSLVSTSSQENALANHPLDHAGHGVLILAVVTLLAVRKK